MRLLPGPGRRDVRVLAADGAFVVSGAAGTLTTLYLLEGADGQEGSGRAADGE